ncbi:MAG: hypothetical protein V4724_26655 [Pseudomonadota bacterium]
MKFAIRLLSGAAICVLSVLAAKAVPQYAWCCGWTGAALYYILIVNQH